METVPSKQPDNETSQHRAGNGTRTLWEPAVTQEEVARVWNDPGSASRLAVERIVMELATLTPDALLGRFMNSPMAARVVPYLGRDIFSGLSALAQPANRLLPLVATSPAAR